MSYSDHAVRFKALPNQPSCDPVVRHPDLARRAGSRLDLEATGIIAGAKNRAADTPYSQHCTYPWTPFTNGHDPWNGIPISIQFISSASGVNGSRLGGGEDEFRSADPNPVPEQIQVPSVHNFQSKLEWNSRHLGWLVPGPVLEPWNERGSQ